MVHWHSSHYPVTQMRNKNSNIQEMSPNVPYHKELPLKENHLLPLGANSFLLRDIPILKRGAIEENQYLIK